MRYVIINADGVAINTVEWDGVEETETEEGIIGWSPPEGCTVELEGSVKAQNALEKRSAQDAD